MEFFEFADVVVSEKVIRDQLTLDNLPHFCSEIESVEDGEALGRVVYFSHWGRFHIRTETVMGGVRFSVPDCPNALVWTVTTGYPPFPEKVVVHCTINRTEHDADFLGGVTRLLAALKEGITRIMKDVAVGKTQEGFQLADFRQKDHG